MRRFQLFAPLVFVAILHMPACGQSSNPATPQHPIDTRPEGTGKGCTYSASRSSGQNTGSSSCPADLPGGATAARRFPYPGEASEPEQTSKPDNAGPPTSPAAQGQGAGSRFPYPGESPTTPNGALKDAGSSGESTSSSSSSSESVLPPDADSNSPDALPTPKRARKKLPPVPRQTPDERELEDVKIAGFYQNDGNYRAAYMRAKDAVGLADDDPEAQFALAEAARKLGKFDEAQKSYKRCLELDPVPKLRKISEKALKEMAGS